jgi:hypothetical protein
MKLIDSPWPVWPRAGYGRLKSWPYYQYRRSSFVEYMDYGKNGLRQNAHETSTAKTGQFRSIGSGTTCAVSI